jgi:hypothetical protein
MRFVPTGDQARARWLHHTSGSRTAALRGHRPHQFDSIIASREARSSIASKVSTMRTGNRRYRAIHVGACDELWNFPGEPDAASSAGSMNLAAQHARRGCGHHSDSIATFLAHA